MRVYIISAILMGVLWYILKHTYQRVRTYHYKDDWIPYKVKRWHIILAVIVFLLPVLNVLGPFFVICWFIVDDSKKFVVDNWFTRKWKKMMEWLSKEI